MKFQSTNKIFMIEPIAFGFNAETAKNNYFQQNDSCSVQQIQKNALSEFNNFVNLLKANGVDVIVFKDTSQPHTPDSIFPNNWISFHGDTIVLYPMYANNRRLERREDIISYFGHAKKIDFSVHEQNNSFLEGTGSIILDRVNHIAYIALSERSNKELFLEFCKELNYKPVTFNAFQTVNGNRLPIYHTNVLMSIAENYAIVCLESIDDHKEKTILLSELKKTGKEIIEISEKQMHCFAGNMLQIRNQNNERFLIMSQSAYDSLSEFQISKLKSFNEFIITPIPTIEKYGGGSVRCMIAEVF